MIGRFCHTLRDNSYIVIFWVILTMLVLLFYQSKIEIIEADHREVGSGIN